MVFLTKDNEIQSKRFLPKRKTVVIPNAIDIEDYNKKQKTSPVIKGLERPLYLGTSAFVEYKRNDLIIRAVSLLKEGSLLLVGDGPLKDKTVKLGKKLLGSRFRYGGVIPFSDRDEVITLYHSADVFVQAANKEAFANVFLEALATNTPVVTQYDVRRKEIISDAGLLVDCSNIRKFASALKHASSFDWGSKPLEQAKNYSWQKIKKRYIDLIEGIENEKVNMDE
jgi:glycosyltransferase involved in cell wall biosynthesis